MKSELAVNPAETQNELSEAIAAHPFCHGFDEHQLSVLGENAMLINFAKGELIFREGDMANRFYLIREGKVALEATRRDEQSFEIQILGPGEVLGWSWLFPPFYWHFDARAIEPTKAIFFYGTRLRERCEEDPSLGFVLMKRMSKIVIERLQSARHKLIGNHQQKS
jgi:CRP/FNR family transcriptional regulator, cyclic AMP receptor protein